MRNRPFLFLTAGVAALLPLAGACVSESEPLPNVVCSAEPLALQNPRAHTLGETFYLPRVQANDGCPNDLAWEVASAPNGSKNVVYPEGGTEPRFTPDVAGDYVLRIQGTSGPDLVLTAVAESPAERFRNHALTPLFGAAIVDGEVWTANGPSYTVTRLSADGASLKKAGEITVGGWPGAIAWQEGLSHALVAQRGSDTVGFIDIERGVLEDAVRVGDEPTALALSPDGARLYVSLPTAGEIAVLDLSAREVTARVAVGFDPRALALTADGSKLFVASFRSGNPVKDTYGTYPATGDQDLWVIDTAKLTVEKTLQGISAELHALSLSADQKELFIAATDGDPAVSQAAADAKSFVHEVIAIDADPASPSFGEVLRRADLSRDPSSQGVVVDPHGILVGEDTVWVTGQASDVVVALDRTTLAEKWRAEVGTGPRRIVALDAAGTIGVHCYMSFEMVVVDAAGAVVSTTALTKDPRPEEVALGERVFNRPGGKFAENHSCNSCHSETQNSGMVWSFGPQVWHNVRPLQLLDATTPIEWGAYVSSTANFGYQGPASIVGRPATPKEAVGLAAFLSSLLGAPRATGHTRPDGSYTEAGLRGKALFEGKATCTSCHVPPLYTSRNLIEKGKSGVPADVPSLLGAYRHGIYFVNGQAKNLEDAVDIATAYVGVELTSEENGDLLEFLRELTPKGSHPLAIWPDRGSDEGVYPDVQPQVAFADAIDDTEGRTAAEVAADHIVLQEEGGSDVTGTFEIEGGAIRFVPSAPLTAGATYLFRVSAGLPFKHGGSLEGERRSKFTVAEAAAGSWPAAMTLTTFVPGPGGEIFPLPHTLELAKTTRPGGLRVVIKPGFFGTTQRQEVWLRVDGDTFRMEPFAIPVSPTGAVGDAASIVGTVTEVDAATKAITKVEGTFSIGAPGFSLPGLKFEITVPVP